MKKRSSAVSKFLKRSYDGLPTACYQFFIDHCTLPTVISGEVA